MRLLLLCVCVCVCVCVCLHWSIVHYMEVDLVERTLLNLFIVSLSSRDSIPPISVSSSSSGNQSPLFRTKSAENISTMERSAVSPFTTYWCSEMIALERASQDEQNGTNLSFITPSSEELWVPIVASSSKE